MFCLNYDCGLICSVQTNIALKFNFYGYDSCTWRNQLLISFSIPGFNGSEDCAALEQLLEGYDQQDQDQVSEVCNSPLFKYMDNDVSRQILWLGDFFRLRGWGFFPGRAK